MDYYNKYLKYKQKYLQLKNLQGGVLPFVTLDDENKTNDYFPFHNENYNYYVDNREDDREDDRKDDREDDREDDGIELLPKDIIPLIDNKKEIDYLLNKRFKLVKLDAEFDKTVYNKKNIINDDNIYKLADRHIVLEFNETGINMFPFHLCLLSKYKILDELYRIYININIDKIKYKYENIQQYEKEKKTNIYTQLNIDQSIAIFKLKEECKDNFLIKNTQQVFKNIFNFDRNRTNEIFDITYNYNILLKYSYCNKFLELLKLIYDIQSKIDYKKFDIITKNIDSINQNNFNNIFILLDNKYNLEDYIAINIINFFIPSTSSLKDKFDKIYN